MRDNVDLVTAADRARSPPSGVRTADGVLHEADVIIYGTGFTGLDFLMPMRVIGRDGVDLHERWDGDARAYLGITVPDFPNLFLLYGPNTNIVVNGSIIYFSECEVHYVLQAMRLLLDSAKQRSNARRRCTTPTTSSSTGATRRWPGVCPTVNTWYKNATGRITQNWPFTLLEYWQQTRTLDPDDFQLL